MKRLLLLMFLLLAITACSPDPRKEAQAFQIREQAEQDALNQAQQRAHAEELHQIQKQEWQATSAEWHAGLNRMIHYGFNFATIGLCLILTAFSVSFSWGSIGVARATARKAFVAANLIPLGDRGQFPLILHHIRGSRYMLSNPNTGSVTKLDINSPADRQLIATSGVTQLAGVIAGHAKQSNDPAGLGVMQPPIVEVLEKDGEVAVGKDIWHLQHMEER